MDISSAQDFVANAMYEAASQYRKEAPRAYLGMSSIGRECSRSIWYSFRGFTPLEVEGRAIMIFRLGDRVEDEVVDWLTRAGYTVSDRQRSFSALGGLFNGHWDGQIEGLTKKPHVLEIKSANAKRFKAYQISGIRKISPEYYAQVQCYMGYSGLDRALFVVMCKDTCEIYTERIPFVEGDFKDIERKASEILTSNRPPDKTETALCEWCSYKFLCNGMPAVQKRKTCGTCSHCEVKPDYHILCKLHDREIKKWGRYCEQWEYMNENH